MIRMRACDSRDEAASFLNALALALESELALRGDVVLAREGAMGAE